MPAKGKRKNNPGKDDRVNPPHKTRLPVTDHPRSLSPTIGGDAPPLATPPTPSTATASDTEEGFPPLDAHAIEIVCQISRQLMPLIPFPDDEFCDKSVSTLTWQEWYYHVSGVTRMLAAYNNLKFDPLPGPSANEAAHKKRLRYEDRRVLIHEIGALELRHAILERDTETLRKRLRVAETQPLQAPQTPTTDTSTQTQSYPVLDSCTQTTPPTPHPTKTNSVSTNIEPPSIHLCSSGQETS
ncbi:hypothetical protein EV426DRAFT_605397 [Tirmania nivea]|nr:hypothetical protein EV426DRAFT_605397 [Tirmania nivea]